MVAVTCDEGRYGTSLVTCEQNQKVYGVSNMFCAMCVETQRQTSIQMPHSSTIINDIPGSGVSINTAVLYFESNSFLCQVD